MHTLRIAVDPLLTDRHGPAVHWAWRLILTSLGYAWEEVSLDQPCDLAHAPSADRAPRAALCVRADLESWDDPGARRLTRVTTDGPWPQIFYAGDHQRAEVVPAGGQPGGAWLTRDVIFDLYWLATGQPERTWPRGAHGFCDVSGTPAATEPLFTGGPASATIAALGRALEQIGRSTPSEPPWPGGKCAAVAMTHDVEYPEVIRWLEPLRLVARRGARGLGAAWAVAAGRRDYWHFDNWQAFEREYGARSAFYFAARRGSLFQYATGTPDPFYDVQSPRVRSAIRRLTDEGWEIGLHASYRAFESLDRFVGEKRRLEEACGCPVSGNRHHYWHLNPVDPDQTLLLHEQAGLTYDMSLMHDRYLGWRRGLAVPFPPFHLAARRELKTLQLPTAWMDAQLFWPVPLPREAREAALASLVDRAAAHRGVFIANVHDYVFDEAIYPGWREALRFALDRIRTRGDFWFATPGEIARHWWARYHAVLEASRGLSRGRA